MDWINISKFIIALVFVLSLMGGLAFLLRYIDQRTGGLNLPGRNNSQRRLSIIERLTLDRQKTALILRIDDRDYLVISGPSGDTVVECKYSDGKIVSFENKAEQHHASGHNEPETRNTFPHTTSQIPE